MFLEWCVDVVGAKKQTHWTASPRKLIATAVEELRRKAMRGCKFSGIDDNWANIAVHHSTPS